jgi:hypothetical protein
MAATRQNPPSATNTERAERNSAGGLILAVDDSTSDASPDMAVQLGRLETLLDRIIATLAPLVGA